MKQFLLSLAAVAVLLAPAAAFAGTWDIDAVHSAVGFKVRHFFTKVPGQFNQFSGTIHFDPENPEKSTVEVTIDASSIDTDNEKRDNHLRSGDFFAVEKHPEITFKSTEVRKNDDGYEVDGILTIRGIEKAVTLQAEFLGAGPDGSGGTRAGFTATTTIDRKEFGVNWNKTLDHGGALLGDEVAINLDVEAVKKKEESGS
jgi:polyisoprenoid-binding protein YceI